jgi:acetyltransferase-like isoleucine patch superfamily enzyme
VIYKFSRVLLLFPGFFFRLWLLAKSGAKDLHNSFRFNGVIIDINCSVCQASSLSTGVHIFPNTTINNSTVEHFSYIGSDCMVQNTTVGRFCSIAKHTLIGLGKHPIDKLSTSPIFYKKNNPLRVKLLEKDVEFIEYERVIIEHDVWIGAKVTVMDGVKICTGAVVATGSVVTKDVPAYAIVGGVPAKIIKFRFSEEVISRLIQSKWWESELTQIIGMNDTLLGETEL